MKNPYGIIKDNQEAYKKASKRIKTTVIKQYVSYLLRVSGQEVIRKGNIVVADPTKSNLSTFLAYERKLKKTNNHA